MTIPYVVSQEVWSAKEANETKTLDSEFERCRAVIIEITTDEFSGTIDIQGKVHELSAFSNIPHIRQDQATIQTPSIAQISHTTNTGVYRYVILGYWRRLRLVMTRSAGSITCGVAGSSSAATFPYLPTALGYEFSINGVNFNGYDKIKALFLNTNARKDNAQTLQHYNGDDNLEDYKVPTSKVFIAFQALIHLEQALVKGRIGEGGKSSADQAIDKEVLKLANGTNAPFMTNCYGVFTAGHYINAETTDSSSSYEMVSGSVLYGIEVDA